MRSSLRHPGVGAASLGHILRRWARRDGDPWLGGGLPADPNPTAAAFVCCKEGIKSQPQQRGGTTQYLMGQKEGERKRRA